MKVILNADQIITALDDLINRIASDIPSLNSIAVIGIRSRGEIIAQRLSEKLSAKLGETIACGTLDITLYRDDLNDPCGNAQPTDATADDRDAAHLTSRYRCGGGAPAAAASLPAE